MRTTLIAASLALALSWTTSIMAQTQPQKLDRFEVAGIFTSITKPDLFESRTAAGFGTRVTLNLNDSVAVEAEANFFPADCFTCANENQGKLTTVLAGIKAGKRFKKFGLFGKARPGIASFSAGGSDQIFFDGPVFTFPGFPFNRKSQTHFAFDMGGVVELYHSRRIFTRYDVGDTVIHYRQSRFNAVFQNPLTGAILTVPMTRPENTTHNFQVSASVGFRF